MKIITLNILKEFKKKILLSNHPIESIYITVDATNPSNLFGGAWSRFGEGKTLVGLDISQNEFKTIGKTGGEKSHTLTVSEMPTHNHTFTGSEHTHTYAKANTPTGSTTLTTAQIPAHNHTVTTTRTRGYGGDGHFGNDAKFASGQTSGISDFSEITNNHGTSVSNTGEGKGHTHTITTTSTNTGKTIQGGTIGNKGNSQAHNNLQPYIVVYMWKRVS